MSKENRFIRIGIAGSHRAGKSTLAQQIAEELKIPYKPVNVSNAPIWAKAHMSAADNVCFAERVKLQEGILAHGLDIINGGSAVYDRTFIDFIGYLYSNVDTTCSNLFNEQVHNIVSRCLHAQISRLDKVIIVQPGITIVEEAKKTGKTYLSLPYMQAMNNHVIATAINYLDKDKYLILPPNMINREDRLKAAMKFINS